jgi:hypothetical protein
VISGLGSQLSVAVADPVSKGSEESSQFIVTSGGQVINGGILSSTNICCRHVLELPQSSVAIQVLEIIRSWGHPPAAVTSEKVTAGELSHASDAVAEPVLPGAVLAVHDIVVFDGQLMTGGILSVKVIICIQVIMLPLLSVAFQVRVIK